MYLDRYFSDRAAFCADLNAFLQEITAQASGRIRFAPYTPDKMNKLAFMCATGSGKTLLMHVNILQFLHYFRRAQRQNSRLSINKAIVLAPRRGGIPSSSRRSSWKSIRFKSWRPPRTTQPSPSNPAWTSSAGMKRSAGRPRCSDTPRLRRTTAISSAPTPSPTPRSTARTAPGTSWKLSSPRMPES